MRVRLAAFALPLVFSAMSFAASSASYDYSPLPDVTAAQYINGKNFCAKYVAQSEIGKFIPIQRHGISFEIYAYTSVAFDKTKPSLIYIDGGPGQNSHTDKFWVPTQVNEIHFDQFGLGCSAPDNYSDYSDPQNYSSILTVSDIESIRQAYGINQISVYGVSYGTVPATMYASLHPKVTRSLILEATIGPIEKMNNLQLQLDGINRASAALNPAQLSAYKSVLLQPTPETKTLFNLLFGLDYQSDRLNRTYQFLTVIFGSDGTYNKDILTAAQENLDGTPGGEALQKPGAVDKMAFATIECKELRGDVGEGQSIVFKDTGDFVAQSPGATAGQDDCRQRGVADVMSGVYDFAKYPLTVPTYYFQGAYDAVTPADGAYAHYLANTKSNAFFLLAQKGGHNPNLDRLSAAADAGTLSTSAETSLFMEAVLAKPMTDKEIAAENSAYLDGEPWILLDKKPSSLQLLQQKEQLSF